MDIASETCSCRWWHYIIFKVIKTTSETRLSLDHYGVDYLLNLYEMSSLEDYVESLHFRDQDIKQENAKRLEHINKIMNPKK